MANNFAAFSGVPLSVAGEAELSKARDNLPKVWQQAPIFDLNEPHLASAWFKALEGIFIRNGVTLEDAKMTLAMDYCSYGTRDVLKNLPSIKTPNWEDFKQHLRNFFPGIIRDGKGSLGALNDLVNGLEPIALHEKGRFCLYDIQFESQCTKLMEGHSLLSN